MVVLEIDAFVKALPDYGAVMGLDLGEKTIGVAVSDTSRMLATPLIGLRVKKFSENAAALISLIRERHIAGVIIGFPYNMDGTEGPRCQSVRAFGRNLVRFFPEPDIPIGFWDERWSSTAMNRFLIEQADLSRAKRSQVIDRNAAAYILQGALDRFSGGMIL